MNGIVMCLCFAFDILRLELFWLWLLVVRFALYFFPNKPKGLKDEVILVTGGSSGIGQAICHELVSKEKNLTIIVWNTNKVKNEAVVKELQELGAKKVVGQLVDVSDREQVKNAAKKIRDEIGDVTMLFNNAGITGEFKSGWSMTPENVEKVIGVNMISQCWTIQEFLPSMIAKGSGHVVTTSSVLAIIHSPLASLYIASKHGLTAYTECLKEDIRNLSESPKIYFTTSFPHYTETAMMDHGRPVSNKYPFLLPKYTSEAVAKRIIQGVLNNEEHIYFPFYWRFVPMLVGMAPLPVYRQVFKWFGIEIDLTPSNLDDRRRQLKSQTTTT